MRLLLLLLLNVLMLSISFTLSVHAQEVEVKTLPYGLSAKQFLTLCADVSDENGTVTTAEGHSIGLRDCHANITLTSSGQNEQEPEFHSIWLSETAIDVTEDDVEITLELVLYSPESALNYAYLYLAPPDGNSSNLRKYVSFSNWVALSEPGYFISSKTVSFDTNTLPGVWEPFLYQADDTNNNSYSLNVSAEDMEDAGSAPYLTVSNENGVDTSPPEILSIELESYTVDIQNELVSVDITITAQDDSPVRFVGLNAEHENRRFWTQEKYASFSQWEETDTPNVYSAQGSLRLNLNTPPGTWRINVYDVYDVYQNRQSISTQSLEDADIETAFSVTNANPIDIDPPEIVAASFTPNRIDNVPGDRTVEFDLELADQSTLQSFVAILYPPSNDTSSRKYKYTNQFSTDGDNYTTGVDFTFNDQDESGQWLLDYSYVSDSNNVPLTHESLVSQLAKLGVEPYVDVNFDSSELADINIHHDVKVVREPGRDQFTLEMTLSNDGAIAVQSFELDFELVSDNAFLIRSTELIGDEQRHVSCYSQTNYIRCDISIHEEWDETTFAITFRQLDDSELHFDVVASYYDLESSYINNHKQISIAPFNRAAHMPDFDGDGKADIAVYRPSLQMILIRQSSDESIKRVRFDDIQAGLPIYGDFDNDTITDVGLYEPATNRWLIQRSSDAQWSDFVFGSDPTDLPVPADFDGDGITDVAIKSMQANTWDIQYSRDQSVASIELGEAGDRPFVADFDGDWITDLGVRNDAGFWIIQNASSGEVSQTYFGALAEDIALPADFDGDGKADLAVRRPSLRRWFVKNTTDNRIYRTGFGAQLTDIPIIADYDGDGITDIAVRRPTSGMQFIYNSTDKSIQRTYFGGQATDIPVAAPMHIKMQMLEQSAGQVQHIPAQMPPSDAMSKELLSETQWIEDFN